MDCKKRNIILLTEALEKNLLFIPQKTIYRWIKEGRNSKVFFKVLGRMAVDMDEYQRLIDEAKKGRTCTSEKSSSHVCSCSMEKINLID